MSQLALNLAAILVGGLLVYAFICWDIRRRDRKEHRGADGQPTTTKEGSQ